MKRILAVLAVAVAVAMAGLTALGQGGPPPVPHEDLTPPADEAARTARRARERQPLLGPEPAEGQNPSAIAAGPKLLPEPTLEAGEPAGDEPVFGSSGFAADRRTESPPDRATGADGTLRYVEVFNPSVVPFKRMSALDAVRADYTLFTESDVLEDVPIGGQRQPDRELFWASMRIELGTGKDVAIPSVSPEMRVLSYEIEPRVGLTFSKDRADNYFVRTDEPGASGTYRLVFLADAASSHFAPEPPPPGVRISDLPTEDIQPLPPRVEATARRVLGELRLHREMRVGRALHRLVAYFRSFEAKDPPPSSGDIYYDLYAHQAGVCRHRSFAFMITANALGIPTRYLSNEAHAWVEVWLPGQGWVRVDLGGAALRLEVSGAEDKAMHQPRSEDPFPKPPAYENNYTQLTGDIRGLSPDQIAERQGSQTSGGDGEGDDEDIFARSAEAAGPGGGRDSKGRLIGPGPNLPAIPEEELANKRETSIEVESVSARGYRGETIDVTGTLTSGGEGLANQRINIFMAPAHAGGENSLMVGYAVSVAGGRFEARVEIPTDFELRTYEVIASTPGDDTYRPSVSR